MQHVGGWEWSYAVRTPARFGFQVHLGARIPVQGCNLFWENLDRLGFLTSGREQKFRGKVAGLVWSEKNWFLPSRSVINAISYISLHFDDESLPGKVGGICLGNFYLESGNLASVLSRIFVHPAHSTGVITGFVITVISFCYVLRAIVVLGSATLIAFLCTSVIFVTHSFFCRVSFCGGKGVWG